MVCEGKISADTEEKIIALIDEITAELMTDTILKLLYEHQRRLERKRNSRDER